MQRGKNENEKNKKQKKKKKKNDDDDNDDNNNNNHQNHKNNENYLLLLRPCFKSNDVHRRRIGSYFQNFASRTKSLLFTNQRFWCYSQKTFPIYYFWLYPVRTWCRGARKVVE